MQLRFLNCEIDQRVNCISEGLLFVIFKLVNGIATAPRLSQTV